MPDTRTTKNADSLTNAQGEFKPHKGPSQPLTTGGHKPGIQASALDSAPTFSAKTAPPGSAPAANTYQPNPTGRNAIPGQANNAAISKETGSTGALDMPGATSADVHTGLGHPGQGQTSSELRHGGKQTAKREGAGLEGVGGRG